MKSFLRCFSLLLLFLLLQVSICYSLPLPAGPQLIQQVCQLTKYYNLCLSSLKSDPRSSKADLNSLAAISLDIASKKATDTFNYLLGLFKRVSDPGDYRRYGTCIEEYAAAVKRHFPEASKELSSKDYFVAIQDLQAAAMNPINCEDQFVNKSPLAGMNMAVHDLTLLASEIIRLLGTMN